MEKAQQVLVIGGTGTIGSELVKLLIEYKQKVRVLTRNPKKAKGIFESSVKLIKGDLAFRETLDKAFKGIDKAFILSQPLSDSFSSNEDNAYFAAKRNKVKHVVKLSGLNSITTFLAGTALGTWQLESEDNLRYSGLSWTILRPAFFFSNLTKIFTVIEKGGLFLPSGNGKDAPIDPRDVADVAAKILIDSDGHVGRTYELTGPELLSYAEMVQKISEVSGVKLQFIDVPKEDWKKALQDNGTPQVVADSYAEYFANGVKENQIYTTPTAAYILGRPTRTYSEWLIENKSTINK
jgi:uncharacterized protein YbjT (DUF2867 family)